MDGESSDTSEAHRLHSTLLSSGWTFQETKSDHGPWLPVKQIPSTVHQDLLDNQLYALDVSPHFVAILIIDISESQTLSSDSMS